MDHQEPLRVLHTPQQITQLVQVAVESVQMLQIPLLIFLEMVEATHLSLVVPVTGMVAVVALEPVLTEQMDKILAAKVELVVLVVLV
jgi:hypothetical protein